MNIEKLSKHVSNQIAAGEVVERPASVVKELIENSLDSGATQVDVDIYRAGRQLIRIKDNGCGIRAEQLNLAVERHATSKLQHIDDLNTICSFGFRGEALASVHSISRLSIFSKTEDNAQAFKMSSTQKCEPCAHPNGTTVEVADLFFNTPARRRFLKSDKTEFSHIDEWIKRFALIHKNVVFTLRHQGKLIRQYKSTDSEIKYQTRLNQIFSNRSFDYHKVDVEKYGLHLQGYIFLDKKGGSTGGQFFYVNGRFVRDRLIQHAAKAAQEQLLNGLGVHYILDLRIPVGDVDINVHPAKQEVRFHDARLVHDFILQVFVSILKGRAEQSIEQAAIAFDSNDLDQKKLISNNNSLNPALSNVIKEVPSIYHSSLVSAPNQQEACLKSLHANILTESHFIDIVDQELWLVDIKELIKEKLLRQYRQGGVKAKSLLMPISLSLEQEWSDILSKYDQMLMDAGFVWRVQGPNICILKIPALFKKSDVVKIFGELMSFLHTARSWQQILKWICSYQTDTEYEHEYLWRFWNDHKSDFIAEPSLVCTQIPWKEFIQKNHERKKQ